MNLSTQETSINVSNLLPGIYFVKGRTANVTSVKRMIKK